MGGRLRTKASGIGQDRHGMWREACRELADDLNYENSHVWNLWKELALVREYSSTVSMHRDVHEAMAHADCVTILDNRGRAPS